MSDEQVQTAQEAFAEFGIAAIAAAEAIVEALRPVIEAVMQAVRQMYQWTRDRYNEAGAPYGSTDDGMLRWLSEVLEAERLRREADLISERRRFLAELRAQRF